jgi:hypothetical protein
VKLLWTKSANPVDWLISLATGQDCAHFAIFFQVNDTGMVFEANLLGTHPVFFKTWMGTSRKIIHEKEVLLTQAEEIQLWQDWVTKFDGQPYDYLGAIYTGLMVLRQRFLGIPKPCRNAWGSKTAFYCDEIYQLVSGRPGFPTITDRSNGMDSPHDVWDKVKGA